LVEIVFLSEAIKLVLKESFIKPTDHGSLTSSRTKFIEAVSPQIALISAGPKKYGSVVLPDEAVVESLEFQGIHILRTDAYDGEICPVKNKVGRDDNRSGGCANFILEW
jgi:beta-lactamase superfamily II metal-dependent hydrolase